MLKETLESGILLLTLDSGKGNLLGREDISALSKVFFSAIDNPTVEAVVLSGVGNAFSTGLKDVAESALRSIPEVDDLFSALDEFLVQLFDFPKPFVAAVNGHSVGAGLLIQLCADHIVASNSDRIKLGFPELKLGATLDAVMIELVRYSIIGGRALDDFVYKGALIDVAMALQLGLLNETVSPEVLLETASKKAGEFAQHKKEAFTATKKALRNASLLKQKLALAAGSHKVFGPLLLKS